jgi:hypothetical protein
VGSVNFAPLPDATLEVTIRPDGVRWDKYRLLQMKPLRPLSHPKTVKHWPVS